MPRPVSQGAPQDKRDVLYDTLRRLSHSDNGDSEATVRALQNQLLVTEHLQVVGHSPDEDEPPDNHEDVRQPIATVKVRYSSARVVRRFGIRVIVVRIRVLRSCEAIPTNAGSHFPTARPDVRVAVHVEAVMDKGDAETETRAVLGRVGRVQKVGEKEADQLKRRGDQGVPAKADEGSYCHSINVDIVGHPKTGDGERGLPVLWERIGSGLLV